MSSVTATMPQTIPSMVSRLRVRLRASAIHDSPTISFIMLSITAAPESACPAGRAGFRFEGARLQRCRKLQSSWWLLPLRDLGVETKYDFPQGLKPNPPCPRTGTAEAVPFQGLLSVDARDE